MAKKILVIDDDAFFMDLTSGLLRDALYEVRTASSGEQGLELARQDPPDLVVLDYMMPGGIDGMTVLQRMKADARLKDVPVVFCSQTRTGPLDVDAAMAAGAADYLVKPYKIKDFLERIRSVTQSEPPRP